MTRAMYTFRNVPDDRKADVEEALRKAGRQPFEHANFPGQVCFYSTKSRDELLLLWANVMTAARAPHLKLGGPFLADH
jgi:hypothetical protein